MNERVRETNWEAMSRCKFVHNKNGNEAVLRDFCRVCQQIKQVVIFPVEMLIYKMLIINTSKKQAMNMKKKKQRFVYRDKTHSLRSTGW